MAPDALAHRRAPTSDLSSPDAARRSLCAAVFQNPACIQGARHHHIHHLFSIANHTHHDLLQLDLLIGCTGEARANGISTPLSGLTLLMTRPGIEHGYRLTPDPAHRQHHVLHVKARVDQPWQNHALPLPLPALLTGLPILPALIEPMTDFIDRWNPHNIVFSALAAFAEALARWPRHAGDRAASPAISPAQARAAINTVPLVTDRVRDALAAFADRAHHPPTLEDLARHAKLSPRHFARVFKDEFARTPHDYLAAQRLDAAKALLLHGQHPVSDIAHQLGFGSPAAFSRWFARLAGQTARDFRKDASVF